MPVSTAKEMQKMLGQKVLVHWKSNDSEVNCYIRDVRNSFGRIQYQIEPEAGKGLSWVDRESVTLIEEKGSYFGGPPNISPIPSNDPVRVPVSKLKGYKEAAWHKAEEGNKDFQGYDNLPK